MKKGVTLMKKSDLHTVLLTIAVVGSVVIGIGVISFSSSLSEEQTKIEAQKILDFRDANYSCDRLLNFYLKFDKTKYNSMTDLKWFHEAEDKLVNTKCIDVKELRELEFINICMDGKTIGCQISKIEHPELYEDFNFKQSIKQHFPEVIER